MGLNQLKVTAVNGCEIKARRHAREIVDDMRWRGMTVPPLYARMAREFQELVRSGDYEAWLTTPLTAGGLQAGGIAGHGLQGRSKTTRAARSPQPTLVGRPLQVGA